MDLYQSVERTRFLGRELLLFLWFESEIFEATLSTSAHGSFGFWVEKELSLGVEKETTRIKGSLPGKAREAKESLLLGKSPEKMGFRLVLGEREASFALRGDTLALSAVSLPTVLDQGDDDPLLEARPMAKKRRERDADREAERVAVEEQEAFFERMRLLREVEEIVEALYRDFLALRLGPAYRGFVAETLLAWARGEEIDAEAYEKRRKAALGTGGKRR